MKPEAFDPPATLDKLESVVETARRDWPHTDLMVFPELYLAGDDPFTGEEPEGYGDLAAQEVPGPVTERLEKVAARAGLWLHAGSVLERAGGAVYNTALLFSPSGRLVGRHRKLVPWAPWESSSPGDTLSVVEIPGKGRVGLMTCYEGWFPEIARALALGGAELILHCSLTTTADREEEIVLARANAITNQCYVINVNAASSIGGGRSVGVDPEGRILFEAGEGEALVLECVDLERVGAVRRRGTRSLNKVLEDYERLPRVVFEAGRAVP